ncbi:diphthine--ammonia ligase [Virgibacillus halodenitrificans]|uniref:Dph6-related ATP pyrophosphatase n=1 Tax=Virgibacillus halodenitrificans TaxID=1482 RepID=UPI001F2FCD7B|nr:diphthine--ammonia ligase [Virgibacillus halodenitrificans]MCG1028955.1 diphthine--ammonia ligase [Virgibacillus halodenitrificans]
MEHKVALSFSGGKDSCLALYYLQKKNVKVECLVTTVWTEEMKTFAHNEHIEQIRKQADALALPLHTIETDFSTYEEKFVLKLSEVKDKYGLDGIAYGDIYLEGHRIWGEGIAEKAGLEAFYPLWRDENQAKELLKDFVRLGFKAEIIKVNNQLPKAWVGRSIDELFIKDITQLQSVCPLGESGEYHTRVYDGPNFTYSLY